MSSNENSKDLMTGLYIFFWVAVIYSCFHLGYGFLDTYKLSVETKSIKCTNTNQ